MELDYKLLFECAPGQCAVLLPNLTVLGASDAYLKATLTTRAEITGKHIFDVLPYYNNAAGTDACNNLLASFNWVIQHKTSHSMAVQKHQAPGPDGSYVEKYFTPSNSPILNAKNELVYILHSLTDISDFMLFELQQKAKDLLTEDLLKNATGMRHEIYARAQDIEKLNETLEKRVLERTEQIEKINQDLEDYKYAINESCIVSLTDERGKILHVNDNFCRVTKYTKEELIGKNHIIFNSGHHPKEFMRQLWGVIESGKIWKGELKNITKDGTPFWVDTTIVPFIHALGRPHKYLAIRYDITERMLSHSAVMVSEEKFRNFFENSLVALFTTDMQNMQPIEVNDLGAALFGYSSRKDFLENYMAAVGYHHADLGLREHLIKTVKETGVLKDSVQKLRRLDGSYFWANTFIRLNKEKNIAQTVMIDVTEQVLAREILESKVRLRTLDLTKNLEREKELNTIKSRFVTTASHEFRTPLTSILSSASLLAMYKNGADEEKKTKHIHRITSSVKTLIDILNDFLSLEQLERGAVETDKSTFSLVDLINSAIEEMEAITTKKKQQVLYRHEGPETIIQSRKILKNMVLNLLSNASKYSLDGKEIVITTLANAGRVTIAVADKGIGIPDEDKKNLFTEFFRAGNAKNIQGTGLGLCIVKKYTEVINGKLSFTSIAGEGSTFTIEF